MVSSQGQTAFRSMVAGQGQTTRRSIVAGQGEYSLSSTVKDPYVTFRESLIGILVTCG